MYNTLGFLGNVFCGDSYMPSNNMNNMWYNFSPLCDSCPRAIARRCALLLASLSGFRVSIQFRG